MIIARPPADHCNTKVVLARKMKLDIYGQPELHHYDIDKKTERKRERFSESHAKACLC